MSTLMIGAMDCGVSDLYALPDLPWELTVSGAMRIHANQGLGHSSKAGPSHMQLSAPATPERQGYSAGALNARRLAQPVGLLSPVPTASPGPASTPARGASSDDSAAATPQQHSQTPNSLLQRAQRERKASAIMLEAAEGLRGSVPRQQGGKLPRQMMGHTPSGHKKAGAALTHSAGAPWRGLKWGSQRPALYAGAGWHPGARAGVHKKSSSAPEPLARSKAMLNNKNNGSAQAEVAAAAAPGAAAPAEAEVAPAPALLPKKKHRLKQWRGYNRRNRKIRQQARAVMKAAQAASAAGAGGAASGDAQEGAGAGESTGEAGGGAEAAPAGDQKAAAAAPQVTEDNGQRQAGPAPMVSAAM